MARTLAKENALNGPPVPQHGGQNNTATSSEEPVYKKNGERRKTAAEKGAAISRGIRESAARKKAEAEAEAAARAAEAGEAAEELDGQAEAIAAAPKKPRKPPQKKKKAEVEDNAKEDDFLTLSDHANLPYEPTHAGQQLPCGDVGRMSETTLKNYKSACVEKPTEKSRREFMSLQAIEKARGGADMPPYGSLSDDHELTIDDGWDSPSESEDDDSDIDSESDEEDELTEHKTNPFLDVPGGAVRTADDDEEVATPEELKAWARQRRANRRRVQDVYLEQMGVPWHEKEGSRYADDQAAEAGTWENLLQEMSQIRAETALFIEQKLRQKKLGRYSNCFDIIVSGIYNADDVKQPKPRTVIKQANGGLGLLYKGGAKASLATQQLEFVPKSMEAFVSIAPDNKVSIITTGQLNSSRQILADFAQFGPKPDVAVDEEVVERAGQEDGVDNDAGDRSGPEDGDDDTPADDTIASAHSHDAENDTSSGTEGSDAGKKATDGHGAAASYPAPSRAPKATVSDHGIGNGAATSTKRKRDVKPHNDDDSEDDVPLSKRRAETPKPATVNGPPSAQQTTEHPTTGGKAPMSLNKFAALQADGATSDEHSVEKSPKKKPRSSRPKPRGAANQKGRGGRTTAPRDVQQFDEAFSASVGDIIEKEQQNHAAAQNAVDPEEDTMEQDLLRELEGGADDESQADGGLTNDELDHFGKAGEESNDRTDPTPDDAPSVAPAPPTPAMPTAPTARPARRPQSAFASLDRANQAHRAANPTNLDRTNAGVKKSKSSLQQKLGRRGGRR